MSVIYNTSKVFLNICCTCSSHIQKHMFQSVTTSVSSSPSHRHPSLYLCPSPSAVCARCWELRNLYSSSREGGHPWTHHATPTGDCSAQQKLYQHWQKHEWVSQGERDEGMQGENRKDVLLLLFSTPLCEEIKDEEEDGGQKCRNVESLVWLFNSV